MMQKNRRKVNSSGCIKNLNHVCWDMKLGEGGIEDIVCGIVGMVASLC